MVFEGELSRFIYFGFLFSLLLFIGWMKMYLNVPIPLELTASCSLFCNMSFCRNEGTLSLCEGDELVSLCGLELEDPSTSRLTY